MIVTIKGKCLSVKSGTNKNTGKTYSYADIYTGNELIKVYNVDISTLYPDMDVALQCNMNVDFDSAKIYFSSVNEQR